jgi:glycosyltransferase involved in cell wall biosynthesis
MNKNPLVSVIIPCYNVSAYVKKAIVSITQQTHVNLEILVIDDASTDDTLSQIKSIEDKRIKVFEYKKNTLKIGAVNEVLQLVKGDFIVFQDADDWSESERIEEQLKKFEADKELGICFTNFRYTGKKIFLPERLALTNDELRNGFFNFLSRVETKFTLPVCASMMISKEVLKQTKGYHPYFAGRVAEDIHWIYRILKNFKGITIGNVLYNYTSRAGSFTDKQFSGANAKYAYSWQLLANIIQKDMHENADLLALGNEQALKAAELEACEVALVENIKLVVQTRQVYEQSWSYQLGRLLLTPFQLIKLGYKILRTKLL